MKNYPISLLCKIAGVSKSGYYKWWKNADKVKDEFDILLIAEMFFKSKQKAGFRTIKMKLLTNIYLQKVNAMSQKTSHHYKILLIL